MAFWKLFHTGTSISSNLNTFVGEKSQISTQVSDLNFIKSFSCSNLMNQGLFPPIEHGSVAQRSLSGNSALQSCTT